MMHAEGLDHKAGRWMEDGYAYERLRFFFP
jgi:hypothetical protein